MCGLVLLTLLNLVLVGVHVRLENGLMVIVAWASVACGVVGMVALRALIRSR